MEGLCLLHDFRHLYATELFDAGVSIAEVARRLRHTTPTTTANIYIHAIDKQDADAAKYIYGRYKL